MDDFPQLILVAGGLGTRLGQTEPKALAALAGKPLFIQSLDAFIDVMRDLVKKAQTGDASSFQAAPVDAPRRRFDETEAARHPVLRWRPDDEVICIGKQLAG